MLEEKNLMNKFRSRAAIMRPKVVYSDFEFKRMGFCDFAVVYPMDRNSSVVAVRRYYFSACRCKIEFAKFRMSTV